MLSDHESKRPNVRLWEILTNRGVSVGGRVAIDGHIDCEGLCYSKHRLVTTMTLPTDLHAPRIYGKPHLLKRLFDVDSGCLGPRSQIQGL